MSNVQLPANHVQKPELPCQERAYHQINNNNIIKVHSSIFHAKHFPHFQILDVYMALKRHHGCKNVLFKREL